MRCTNCDGELKYYDKVRRIVRHKNGETSHIYVPRYRCTECKHIHRHLPDCITPYKQYEVEIIKGVVEGLITSETLGYEDYPCEMTMTRWKTEHE